MTFIKRRKMIVSGKHSVRIESIKEKSSKSGKRYFVLTVKRISDGAKGEYWIHEDSYKVDQILDVCFKDDKRESFEVEEFKDKEIDIEVKENNSGFYNIFKIGCIGELKEIEELQESEKQLNLEEESIKEDNHYTEEDDDLIGNIDFDALDNIDLDALDKVNLDDELDDDFNFGDESDDDFNFDYIIGEA